MKRTPSEIARKWREIKYWMDSMHFDTPECLLILLKAALSNDEGNCKQLALVEEMW